jgi:hypothetical protein
MTDFEWKDLLFILLTFIGLNFIYFAIFFTIYTHISFLLFLLLISGIGYFGVKRAISKNNIDSLWAVILFGLIFGYQLLKLEKEYITLLTSWFFLESVVLLISTFFIKKKK